MIRLKNVIKSFNGQRAVNGINIDIKPGEIVGLLGPNGAGKTTTIRMIAGVLPVSEGMIEIDSKNYIDHEFEIKEEIGYLPENNPLYDDLTVEEHLKFWGKLKGLDGKLLNEAIKYAVEKTGISSVFYRPISELSKGYRQRVGLAQAILKKPKFLLLDEPTEGLDPNQRKEIQILLAELKKDRTVIVSSHVLGEISKLASRIIIINKGKVVGDDSPQKMMQTTEKTKTIEVEIEGKNLQQELKKIDGVKEVTKNGKNIFNLISDSKVDIRPKIFKLSEKQGWTLLSMREIERELDDVFAELTNGGK